MIVSSIRKLAKHVGKSHVALSRDLARGKFRPEPDGGFHVEKVKTAPARAKDISQPTRHDSGLPEEVSAGSAYDIYNRARAANMLTAAKERQLAFKKRQGELVEVEDMRTWTSIVARFETAMSPSGRRHGESEEPQDPVSVIIAGTGNSRTRARARSRVLGRPGASFFRMTVNPGAATS